MTDTIVALATPPGEGGIAIVRLSGPQAVSIADALFRGRSTLADLPSHRLAYGRLALPSGSNPADAVQDEVLVSVMRAPHSYTREDVVEINCHGGVRLADEVIRACVERGARRAERGEFTERAFLNGRLDLAQAEAVLDMVRARTRTGLAAACYQLTGGLSARLAAVSGAISASLVRIEAGLEFDEEDLGVGDPRREIESVRMARETVDALRATYERGRLITTGATVAILGPPNVGKSSIMNAILGEERAIVSPIPGTTRDLVEGEADFDGIRVRLVDTAGLRETGDMIEREGTRRAERAAEAADAQVLVCDASGEVPPPRRTPAGPRTIVVINKRDIADADVVERLRSYAGNRPVYLTSALRDEGIDALCQGIRELLIGDAPEPAAGRIILRERHAEALRRCAEHLGRAREEMAGQAREELVAADLRLALDEIGQITGETTPEDILRKIFGEFCIGK